MAVAVASSSTFQALEDSSQPASQSPSPSSPTPSAQFQQSQLSRPTVNLNGSISAGTRPSSALEPSPGTSYREFLRTWTDGHVALWLSEIKCGHHAATFKANDIRGDVLLELDQITLKEMGMVSVGDRLRIVNAVKALRQKCSNSTSLPSALNRPRTADHSRNSSVSSEVGGASRASARRLESGRPAPLHLPPNGGTSDLPRLLRDGPDSARYNGSTARPLPQPSGGSAHGTPTTAHSVRTHLPPLPPPRAASHHSPQIRAARVTSQYRKPRCQDGQQGGNWSSYGGLPGDLRRAPSRSTSPLPLPVGQPPARTASRGATDPVHHVRNGSHSTPPPPSTEPPSNKLPPRPRTGNASHPYANSLTQQAHGLSPISENYPRVSQATTPSPPTAPSTEWASGLFSDPFTLPDEGKSTTLNVTDCAGGVEVLVKALKKFGKLGSEGMEQVETDEGGLSVEGWGVYLGQDNSMGGPLTEAQLLSICHAPPDDPAREYGLTLRVISRTKRPSGQSPTSMTFVVPGTEEDDDDDVPLERLAAETTSSKATKRASSISILSGLGVKIPDKTPEGPSSSTSSSPSKSPTISKKGPSKLRNFFGQRPPSELITTHLAEYFPFTEKKVLERTRRQSMMRASGAGSFGKRDSIVSWNQPSQSRFSVSTLGSQRTPSPRASMSSSSITAVERASSPVPSVVTSDSETPKLALEDPPRLSLSTDDGHSVDLMREGTDESTKRLSSPHLLPPVAFPSESLSESMNLGESLSSRRFSRTLSTASKRMSYITELRSKRDRSDTWSLLTVDEITAEVESRQVNSAKTESSDEWTQVEAPDDADKASINEDEDDEDEDDEGDDDTEEDVAGDDTATEDDEPGKAITSHGSERTIKWIKGALIGAGSFGKVYLGMDAATGLLMAVKQVELPTGSAPNEERKKSMLSALEREIELLKNLQHENIVQYHSSCIDDDHLNIFLEYVPGGSVTSLLRNYGAFEEGLVRNWVRQILLGLNYLHERDIIHRDIKGANMLVDNKGGIKISDFGISKKVEDNLLPGHRAHRPSLQGSVFWMAPEVVKQTAYTFKADIWSVGCLVVEMLTGEHPWAQLTQMQAIFKIGSSAKPTIPADISPEAVSFLQLTFELNHEARPSAAELLKHPWVANQPSPLGS
ncbi:Protein kinase byr2 [Grifola frondosa]|uniref:Protein kinase byr2 n=1 Tax=Grifola frondosa TaxID=5627 RepID=A0A1C7MFB1_GRIFR|nr:Protein kinase byr2 [Grifola frondosa]